MSMRTTSGRVLPATLDGLDAVDGLADDLDVRLGLQDHPEPRAQELLVVGDEDADHAHIVRGVLLAEYDPAPDRPR